MEIITEQILQVKLVFKEQLPKINLRNVPYHRLIVECFEILSRNGFEWLQFKYKLHKNWLASLLSILFYLYHFFQSAEIQKFVPSLSAHSPRGCIIYLIHDMSRALFSKTRNSWKESSGANFRTLTTAYVNFISFSERTIQTFGETDSV